LGGGGHHPWLGVVGLLPVLALVAVACGGTGNASPNASSSTATREAALLSFAKCMRQHGVNLPDPTVDANGNVVIQRPRDNSGGSGTGSTPSSTDRSKFQTARTACQKYLAGVFQGFSQADRTKIQDTLVKYAQCMRAHGYNMPDPNFNNFDTPPSPGSGPGGAVTRGPFGNINRNDPAFQTANQACRSILTSAGLRGGGFGIRFGGGGGSNP